MIHLKAANITRDFMQKFIIEDLIAAGITESQDGKSIYEMEYDELLSELVLAAFSDIEERGKQDATNLNNRPND